MTGTPSQSPGGPSRDRWIWAAAGLFAVAAAGAGAHWCSKFAGDALIHLCIMEQSAAGHWFQFQPHGSLGASSSPLWTIIGALLWKLGGLRAAALGLKAMCGLAWLALGGTTTLLARRLGASAPAACAMGLLAIALPGTALNALLGMENGSFAVVVVGMLLLFARQVRKGQPGTGSTLALFGFAGLSIGLRPEGVIVACSVALAWLWWVRGLDRNSRVRWLIIAVVAGVLVSGAVWGFYWAETGRLVPESGISRVMMARRQPSSFRLGPVWIYPRAGLRLFAYAPLAGFAVLGARHTSHASERPQRAFLAALLGAAASGIFLYSFVTGAAHTSRYLIWVFALVCALAAPGIDWAAARSGARWQGGLALAAAWIVAVGGGETWIRLKDSRTFSWQSTTRAVANRRQTTSRIIKHVCAYGCCKGVGVPRIAAVEVELRLFLDHRIAVESLDGVTGTEGGSSAMYGRNGCVLTGKLAADRHLVAFMGVPGPERCLHNKRTKALVNAFRLKKSLRHWTWDPTVGLVRLCGGSAPAGRPSE